MATPQKGAAKAASTSSNELSNISQRQEDELSIPDFLKRTGDALPPAEPERVKRIKREHTDERQIVTEQSPPSDHNASPELQELTEEQRTTVEDGANAVIELKKTFDHHMRIGHGLAILQEQAQKQHPDNKRNAWKVFDELRQQADYSTLDRPYITRLLQIVEREPEVRKWRDTLTTNQRWAWSAPQTIINHCQLFKKPPSVGSGDHHHRKLAWEKAVNIIKTHMKSPRR